MPKTLHLNPHDNVAIALADISLGEEAAPGLTTRAMIPSGHKIALKSIKKGALVHRYGLPIGFASTDILPGDHIHTHNLTFGEGGIHQDYEYATDADPIPAQEPAAFPGYRRADGRVGIRNTIAVIATSNCAAEVVRIIARRAREEMLPDFPHVDDVFAIKHGAGCSMDIGGDDLVRLRRTLAGLAQHPNVSGYVFVALGCEVNQMSDQVGCCGLPGMDAARTVEIQGVGGAVPAIEAGLAHVRELLGEANALRREPCSTADLVIGLECGGSDSWSGITANPALGRASDRIVAGGGTTILAETSELAGVEHLLTRRSVSREVGEKFRRIAQDYEHYVTLRGSIVDHNPTPGNKAGGLTTIYEKSIGAMAKGGSAPLSAVYDFAERVTAKGLTIMDTPGNDWTSATGMLAGGAHLIVFTTGRGSVAGYKPGPCIKIATNSALYGRMSGDMDINAGVIVEGESPESVGDAIFEKIVAVASGERTKSEALGFGEETIHPWLKGAMM